MDEDNTGLGITQHNNLVDTWNIDPLIEDVHGQNIIQVSRFQSCHHILTDFLGIFPGQGLGPVTTFIELMRQLMGFVLTRTEDKPLHRLTADAIIGDLLNQVIDTIIRHQLGEVASLI